MAFAQARCGAAILFKVKGISVADTLLCIKNILFIVIVGDAVGAWRTRRGVAVVVAVGAEIPLYIHHLWRAAEGSVNLEDTSAGADRDIAVAIVPFSDADIVAFEVLVGIALQRIAAVTHCDVSATYAVYLIHEFAKHRAMRAGVGQLEIGDEIVDHLMDNGVLHHIFAKVVARAYP